MKTIVYIPIKKDSNERYAGMLQLDCYNGNPDHITVTLQCGRILDLSLKDLKKAIRKLDDES